MNFPYNCLAHSIKIITVLIFVTIFLMTYVMQLIRFSHISRLFAMFCVCCT